jgi:hypothetical protein
MRADELHIDGLVAIRHRDHQAVVIALDVEDNPAVLEDTGVAVPILDVGRCFQAAFFTSSTHDFNGCSASGFPAQNNRR